jgi:glycosyltransferase involved in cell wall biosynthesis
VLPPVSVIIPTYNRCRHLSGAMDSVLSQDYPDLELLIIDDGSTDSTPELLAGYGSSIRVITQENRGASAARNAGIRTARHDLLAFLDSDDQFAPGKLALQAEAMTRAPEYLISHTDEVWYRRGQLLEQKKKHARSGGDLFARSLKLCVVGMSTVMVHRELFTQVGLFDEELACCEDYDLWLRTAWRLEFLHVPETLTIKHGGRADQLSRIHRVGMDRFRIKALVKLLREGGLNAEQEKLARQELVKKCRIYGRGCLKHGRQEEGESYLGMADKYAYLLK